MFNMIIKFFSILLLYFLSMPLLTFIGNQIVASARKTKVKPNKLELSFFQKVSRYRRFGLKEAINKKKVKIVFILLSLAAPLISLLNIWAGIVLAIILPFVCHHVIKSLVKKELDERDALIERMLLLKKSKMGLIDNKSNKYNYYSEFEILEYDENDRKPSIVKITLPPTFDPLGSTRFIGDFSIQFGRGRPFEIDRSNKDYNGWDTEKGAVVLKLESPLPTIAPWDARYLEDPIVQWSFFPLGLSSKGGIPLTNPETGEVEHVVGFDVDGTQRKYCDKNGIIVGDDIVASPMTLIAGVTGGGKSVGQWNIMNGCLARPEHWLLFGIDMKKVELSQLRKFGVAVGTTYEDSRDIATFVQKVMTDRYEEMEKLGINNWGDMEESKRGPAIFLLVDELGELLAPIAGKSDEAKEQQECQDQIRGAFESIARLGRAARVFIAGAAQRPSADIVPMQLRQNMSNKLAYGTLPATISAMQFENNEGARIPGNPRGRAAIKVHSSEVNHFQGFFSPTTWIEEYRESKGLPIMIYGDNYLTKQLEEEQEQNRPNLGDDEMTEEEFAMLKNAMK